MQPASQPFPTGTLVFVLVAFPIFFTILWVGICAFLSVIGGWKGLASSYTAAGEVQGKSFRGTWGSMSAGILPVRYNGVLNVVVAEEGIGLSVAKIFAILHPPLFIPWEAIGECKEGFFLFWPGVQVSVRGGGRFILRGACGKTVFEAWRSRVGTVAAVS